MNAEFRDTEGVGTRDVNFGLTGILLIVAAAILFAIFS
jgi:hypothetical protein